MKTLKRCRLAPNKRWVPWEETALANFLKENLPIEKPTSKIYYSKFLEQTKMDASWKVPKAKTRYMRACYKKTKDWLNSAQVIIMNEDEIRAQVLNRCSYFDIFDELFQYTGEDMSNSFKIETESEPESDVSQFSDNLLFPIINDIPEVTAEVNSDVNSDPLRSPKTRRICNNRESRIKRRRQARDTPNYRWQPNNEAELINFLKNNREFELPTARIYYGKFIKETGMKIDWSSAKGKVRNMRVCFKKAKDWALESGNGVIDSKIRRELLKRCTYFNDFEELFELYEANPKFSKISAHDFSSKNMFPDRDTPYFKWQPNDEAQLTDFLKNNREFELPNSRLYYGKFLEQTGLETDWISVKSKVRNMRICYKKTKDWAQRSNDVGTDMKTTREMERRCPYYKSFDELFELYETNSKFTKFSTHDLFPRSVTSETHDFGISEISEDFPNSMTPEHSVSRISQNTNTADSDVESRVSDYCAKTSRRSKIRNVSVSHIIDVQSEILNFKKQKFELDKKFKERELALMEKKLNFEENKLKMELDIRERELESQERMKKLELEMKERIALKELEMKEKIALKEIEKKNTNFQFR